MRKLCGLCLLTCSFLFVGGAAQAGDTAHALIARAIKAAGGEEALKKHQASTWSEKGTYYGMGDGLPYTSKLAIQFPGQSSMQVFGGEMEIFAIVVDNDKGWIKTAGEVRELTKDELKNHHTNAKAGWIASLLPLKDKAFSLKVVDGVVVDQKPTAGVEVTRADYPEVKLYFDKKSGLLVMSKHQAFSSEQKKTVLSEVFYQNYKLIDGAQVPTHIILKHDGKLFVEADIFDLKAGHLAAKVFAAPK